MDEPADNEIPDAPQPRTVEHAARKVLAANMRRLMKRKHLTLRTVAARSGLNYEYLSAVSNAHDNISLDNLEKVAAALGEALHKLLIPETPEKTHE